LVSSIHSVYAKDSTSSRSSIYIVTIGKLLISKVIWEALEPRDLSLFPLAKMLFGFFLKIAVEGIKEGDSRLNIPLFGL
jgi:hypothetical protein